MTRKVWFCLFLLILPLAGCDDPLPPSYSPAPQVDTEAAPTRTAQEPKPLATAIQTRNDPVGETDEIVGGGKPDLPWAQLTVHNQTSDVICDLFIWPYHTTFTNQDLLGDGKLDPGQKYKIERFDSGFYHLQVVNCAGDQIRRDAELKDFQTWKLYYFPK